MVANSAQYPCTAEESLSRAQRLARFGVFSIQLHTQEINSSSFFDQIFGLDPEAPKNVATCMSHVHPDFVEKIAIRLVGVQQNGGQFEEDFKVFRANDHEERWVSVFAEIVNDENGQPKWLNGVVQDITERKQADIAAQKNRSDLEFIIATLPDILLRIDRNNRLLYVHANHRGDLVLPEAKIVGKKLEDLNAGLFQHLIIETMEKARQSGKVESCEYCIDTLKGKNEWFEARMIRAEDDEILILIRNITEQKSIRQALEDSESLLRDIFNLSPVPMSISRLSDGKLIMTNEALEELTETTFEAVAHLPTMHFYHDLNDRQRILEQLAVNGMVKNLEIQMKKPNGELVPSLMSCQIVSKNGEELVFAGMVDIRERKKAELTRQQNEKLLQDIFNFSPIAMIITQLHDGKILMANEAAGALAGLTVGELLGRSVAEFYDDPVDRQKLLEGIQQHGQVKNMEMKLRDVSSTKSLGLVSTSAIEMNGEKVLFTGFVDITELKAIESELNNSLALVKDQNNRLLNFSYIVSHNLRSHAGNLETIANFLQQTENAEERSEILAHLNTVITRLNETLKDLNEVVSIQKNLHQTKEPLSLHAYAERAKALLETQMAGSAAIFENRIDPALTVQFNPAYLESVMLNLISNALKYADPHRKPHIILDAWKENANVVFQIQDNGMGIDLEKYGDKIFGMYKTFHGNKEAKGIGLFMCKNQIEAMGGRITVESRVGEGTVFKIFIQ